MCGGGGKVREWRRGDDGGERKRWRGRRSDLYRSGSGCGTCGAGLRSDTGRKGGARMLQSVPKFGPPGGPANHSTLLFPLCFQYAFLKGNNRRAARRSRFGPARRSRFGPAWRTQNETESCTRQSEISQPPTQEFWNLSSTIHPTRPTLSRSLNDAQPLHSIPPAALASSRPSTTIVTMSHTRANINHIQPRLRRRPRASAFN